MIRLTVYLVSLMFSVCSVVLAGGMTSSGGDYLTTEHNPWFIGDEPVSYCVEKGDFSRDLQSSEVLIEEAVNDWVRNLKNLTVQPTSFVLPDGKKKSLSFNFIKTACSEKTDLRFLLGVNNSAVEAELKHLATYVVGFASKERTDDFTGRAKGFIWISPDEGKHAYKGPAKPFFWRKDAIFYNVVLHELGHVFGLDHQSSGFMSSSGPSYAVLGIGGDKNTVASLTAQSWLQTLQTNCGSIWGQESSIVAKLIGFTDSDGIRVCVVPVSSAVGSNIRFNLKFSNKSGERVSASFEGVSDVNVMGKATVNGKYFKNAVGTPLDYEWHTFFDLGKYKLVGKLQLLKKTVPVVIEQKMGNYLDYSVFVAEDIITFKSNLGIPTGSDWL